VSAFFHLWHALQDYGWADDWAFLSGYRTNGKEIRQEHLSGLRPLLQPLMDVSFGNIDSYENLVYLRIISVVGMILLTHTLITFLLQLGYSKSIAMSFGILLNLLPTFWIYTHWATVFTYSWICLFSVFSYKVYLRNKALGIFGSTLCFLVYQPAAVFSMFLIFARFLKNKELRSQDYLFSLSIVASSMCAYVLAKLTTLLFDSPTKGRTNLVDSGSEFIDKAIWVASRPVVLSFRPFIIESHGFVSILATVAGFVLCSVTLINLAKYKTIWSCVLNLTLIYVIALLPVIVIAENQIEFRTLPATSAIGLLFVLSGFHFVFSKRKIVPTGILLLPIVCLVLLYAGSKIQSVFIDSFNVNKKLIEGFVETSQRDSKYLVIIDQEPWPQKNYIGSLSVISDLQMPWVPQGEIAQILGVNESVISVSDAHSTAEVANLILIPLTEIRSRIGN
jgi:hypothetical protein